MRLSGCRGAAQARGTGGGGGMRTQPTGAASGLAAAFEFHPLQEAGELGGILAVAPQQLGGIVIGLLLKIANRPTAEGQLAGSLPAAQTGWHRR
jgi:hypothetical protein